MAATGSQLAFFGNNGLPTNLVLTATGTGVPAPAAGFYNIEVFTASPAGGFSLAPGYDASAYIEGAVLVSSGEPWGC